MATWKFTDHYQASYPALQHSVLSLLVFAADPGLTPGNASQPFSGTLDVAASGAVLTTLGNLLSATQLAVSGTVAEAGNTLTVTLKSTETTVFHRGVAAYIPLIAKHITDAELDINTMVTTTDDPDDVPPTDVFDLSVTLGIASASVTLTTQVPMHDGLFSLTGAFTGVSVGLADLDFLMGSLAGNGGHAWFPSEQLGPYAKDLPTLSLLSLALTANVTRQPSLAVGLSSLTACVGIPQLRLMGKALYLNPLEVWLTVADPTGSATVAWGLEGSVNLYNYAAAATSVPGQATPDFAFDFTMGFPTTQHPGFSLSGTWQNNPQPTSKNTRQYPVSLIIQDLLGPGVDVGIGQEITINALEFETQADVETGTITDFSMDITLLTGFGLFAGQLDVEEIALTVTYSGS